MSALWIAELTPNSNLLDWLTSESSGFDVWAWREEEDSQPAVYFWSSPHLDELENKTDVQNRAAALRALWNGILYVVVGPKYYPLGMGRLQRAGFPPADHTLGDPYSPPFPTKPTCRKPHLSPFEGGVDRLMALCRYDQSSCHCLQALGITGPTLPTLFLLYEDMKLIGKWSDARIDSEGKATTPTAKRFRATVNNPATSGPESRHGGEGSPPMSAQPTSQVEAATMILTSYHAYLLSRISDLDLAAKLAGKQ